MVDLRGVVAVHCTRRVEQRRQEILLDVAHLRCIPVEAVQHIFDVQAVEPQQLVLDGAGGLLVPGDADDLPSGTERLRNEIDDFIQAARREPIILYQHVVAQIPLHQPAHALHVEGRVGIDWIRI